MNWLERLTGLAAVERKFSLGYQDLEPEFVLQALEDEFLYKPGYAQQNGIGFMSRLAKR